MKESNRPIVVFDSGLGGISVLRQLLMTMPNESFVYLGDSANAPYGPRPQSEVCRLTLECIGRLDDMNPKAVVIACNTATAASLPALEAKYPSIPVIGIEPAVRAACAAFPEGHVLSLATAGTIGSERYRAQLESLGNPERVVSLPAPGIVEYVESGLKGREEFVGYLRDLFAPWRDVRFDAVVLGCTHFPFAVSEISEALGYEVSFFEPSKSVAEKTLEGLRKAGTAASAELSGSLTVMNSANSSDMLRFAWGLITGAFNH